jgi:hypothetical protein
MQKRLFTFGCSFTRYKWPTWADALAPLYDSHQNWAQGGAGNSFILSSLAEAHARNTITEHDTVIVMWTSRDRNDVYKDGAWQTPGSAVVDTRGSLVRDCANIVAAEQMLKGIGCEYYFLSMIYVGIFDKDPDRINKDNCEFKDVLDFYQPYLHNIRNSMYEIVYNFDWHNAAFADDYHPTPQQHLDYLDEVLPELEVDGQTRLKFAAIEKRVRNGRWTDNEHWHDGYLVERF